MSFGVFAFAQDSFSARGFNYVFGEGSVSANGSTANAVVKKLQNGTSVPSFIADKLASRNAATVLDANVLVSATGSTAGSATVPNVNVNVSAIGSVSTTATTTASDVFAVRITTGSTAGSASIDAYGIRLPFFDATQYARNRTTYVTAEAQRKQFVDSLINNIVYVESIEHRTVFVEAQVNNVVYIETIEHRTVKVAA
jgi:hypothetical protein|tara:strand:- start:336 stop:929 length:594 start_codon:yes stop_codon:yes gene_type:complete